MKFILTKAFFLVFILFIFSWNYSGVKAQCRPTYYTGFLNYGMFYSVGDTITRVTFNTLNNYSGNSAPITDSVYSDYTHLSTTVCKGQSYTLSVWAGDTSIYHTGVIAWIDFNNNNIFETTEMVLRDSVKLQNRTQAATASVSIPINAVTGSVKMRVLSAYTIASVFPNRMPPNDPCFNYSAVCHDSFPSLIGIPYPDLDPGCNLCISCDALSGEVEEYTINILARPTASMSGSQTICPGSGVMLTFNLTGSSPWDLVYTDGTNQVTRTGITSNPYFIYLSVHAVTTFSPVFVSDQSCFGGTSGNFIVDFLAPPQVQFSGISSICSGNGIGLTMNLSGNAPPWRVTYTDGTNNVLVTGITASPWVHSVTPNSSRTYTPTVVTDICRGGTVSGTQQVLVSPTLSAVLSGGGPLCQGNSSQLTIYLNGVSPWSLSWTDGTNLFSQTGITSHNFIVGVTPTSNATYTLNSVSDACSGSGLVHGIAAYSIIPAAQVQISGSQSICPGNGVSLSFNLQGQNPWSFSYSDGTNTSSLTGINSNPWIVSVSPNSTRTYTPISVQDACGSGTVSGQQVVVVHSSTPPQVQFSGSSTICPGNGVGLSMSLSGVSPWSVTYTDGTSNTLITGITTSPWVHPITPTSSRTYTPSVVSDICQGGTVSGQQEVFVSAGLSATLSGGASLCPGNSSQFSIQLTGVSPWTVTWTDGTNTSSQTGINSSPFIVGITPSSSITYTLNSVSDACSGSGLVQGTAGFILTPPAQVQLSGSQTICLSHSASLSFNLQGQSPWSISYSDGTNTSSLTGITSNPWIVSVSPNSTRTYTPISVQDACGSGTVSGQQVVVVNSNPTANLAGNSSICLGNAAQLSIQLTGSSPWTFTWTDGTNPVTRTGITSNPFVFALSPVSTTNYSLNAVSDACFSTGITSGTALIQVNALPIASLNNTSTYFCNTPTLTFPVNLSGTQPWSISYSEGTSNFNLTGITASPYSVLITPNSSRTYSLVSVSDANCNSTSVSGTAIFIRDDGPVATLSGAQTVCMGGPATFQITGTNGLQLWDFTFSDGTSALNYTGISSLPYQFSITPTSSATYTVTAVNHSCTSVAISGNALVSVVALPTASFSGPSSYCAGNSVPISVGLSGTAPWSIQYTEGTSSLSMTGITSNPYGFTVSPQGTATYSLTQVQDANCSQSQNSTIILTEAVPLVASWSGGGVICAGGSLGLSAGFSGPTPYEFQWSDGSNTQTVTGITTSDYTLNLSPTSNTTYTVVQVSNSCGLGTVSPASQTIQILANPQATLSGTQTLCGSGLTNFSVQFNQSSGPYNLSWSDGVSNYLVSGITSNPYTLSQNVSSSKTFTLIGVNNGLCTGTVSGQASVNVIPAPTASWQDSVLLCPGGSFSSQLSLTGAGPWNVSYSNGQNTIALSGISASPWVFTQSPLASTTYVLSQVSDSNCPGVANGFIYAELNPLPAAIISVPSPVCQGATVPVSVTFAGTAPWSINWTDGVSQTTISGISTSPFLFSITPDTSFNYGLAQLQDAYCTDTNLIPVSMVIQPLPTAYFTLSFTTWDSVQFTNASQNFSSVNWDFGDQSSSTQLNPLHAYTSSANSAVTIKLTASNVCGTAEFDTTLTISGQSISEMLNPIWVKVFPNPVNDFIRITQNEESLILQFMLTDVLGKELNAWKAISHSEEHVSLVDFPAGIYFLKIRSEKHIHSEQIIKLIKY